MTLTPSMLTLPPYTNRRYLDALADHVVLFDGAMGTSIQRYNLTPADFGGAALEGCNDVLVLTRPDVIAAIHASFLAVGCEVVETNTFRSNRLTLAEYGLADKVAAINQAAAALARAECDRAEAATGVPRFVAGSMGPSGKLPSGTDPDLSDIAFDALAALFAEQAEALVMGGADLLLLETGQDLLELKAAVHGIAAYFVRAGLRVPMQVQVTLDTTGRMLFGTDVAAALVTLGALPIDVLGMNCSTGPEFMRAPIQYLAEHSPFPISVLPNAGLPINVDGEAVYPMEPGPFADMVAEFARWGVGAVGGCCGTRPEHLAALHQALHGAPFDAIQTGRVTRLAPRPRPPFAAMPAMAASAMTAMPLVQVPSPTLVGERVNSQGSRKVKRLLLADDYDSIVQVAVEQVEAGAHILDVAVALTERDDERAQMTALVKKLAQAVSVPLMIDTTEADVAEAALAAYPGRGVLNGNNLENGRDRIDTVLPVAVKHGAAVLSMTIDEVGMAHTRAHKLAVARRIHDIAVGEYGLRAEDLIFDVLTFPLTTGQAELRQDAIETLEGLRLVKRELPGVLTALGISNVSFGVTPAARAVLNSVFLYHAVQHGLDLAIVNPAHVTPYADIPAEQRTLADDLIFDRDEDALARFIQYFEQHDVQLASTAAEDPTATMTDAEALHWHIVHRKKDGVEARIDACLRDRDAVGVLNEVLLPAMKEVGDKFGAGELILPFVLQSAEVMKTAVAYLERFMDKLEGVTKGVVVLATVYGDVHDIGKNLVKTILANNGYTVHDLGKQVPANTIVEQAAALHADAVGLSALLVSTSKQMPVVVNALHARGVQVPVLVGGAAINRAFGRRIAFLDDAQPYAPGVFYCKDAFEGLAVMDALSDPQRRNDAVAQVIAEAHAEMGREAPTRASARPSRPSRLKPAPDVPTPPFWGARTVRDVPLDVAARHLHTPELFRLSWGAGNTQGEAWHALEAEYKTRLAAMTKAAMRERTIQPQGVYGYFPANRDGDTLIVWDAAAYAADGTRVEAARFAFPRQPDGEHLCLADYCRAADEAGGGVDVVALQVATVGQAATEHFDALQAAHAYSDGYFFHGLAVQMAEATANVLTAHMRRELGLAAGRGKRYSWGYPAIPDLDDHAVVFALLPGATRDLGLSLTVSGQIVPEQSTAALFVHHPGATYFSVGVNRTGQLLAAANANRQSED